MSICVAIKGNGDKCTYKSKVGDKCGMHSKVKKTYEIDFTHKHIFTVGHSTHDIALFIKMLKINNIVILVDVRSVPKSRKNPQYGNKNLKLSLKEANIKYKYIEKLGGFRKPTKDSINTGWKHKSFRAYADYMMTSSFQEGLKELESLAETKKVAYMCSESVPWRCHRSLISDALKTKGWQVGHIMTCSSISCHQTTSFLKIDNDVLTYPQL